MHLTKIRSLAMVGALIAPALAPSAQAAPFTCSGLGLLDPTGGAAIINLALGTVGCIVISGASLVLDGTIQPSATVGTHANGSTIVYTYDGGGGGLASVTGPNGVTTTYQYDGLNRMTTVADDDPPGHTTTYTYDGSSNRIQSTTGAMPGGNATSYTYDTGRLSTQTTPSPGGLTTTYTYDTGNNRLTDTVDDATPTPQTTMYQYDDGNGGRLMSTTDADGHVTTYLYDGLNRLSETVRDDDGRTTTYEYDSSDRIVQSIFKPDPLDDDTWLATTYAYDAFNRLTSSSDGETTMSAVSYVPEPGGLALFGAALAAAAGFAAARHRPQPA